MDEGKFVADFISANLEKIIGFAKNTYGKVDAALQVNLKTAYADYLNASRLKYSKSKSFFIRSQPVELYSYYVPTGIVCSEKLIKKPDFIKCTEFTNRIVISGTGGSGKSVLIKHLFLNCIEEKTHAPILIELRDLNSHEESLDEFINEALSNFGFKTSDDFIRNAKEAGHFCYFFDGFDEVTPKLRNKVIKDISSLSKKYPKCPIFISSRPDDTLEGLDDFSTFSMCPLSLDEALELVSKLPFDDVIKKKFCSDLTGGVFEKHKSFLSNPLLLSIMLLTYGEFAEIPSKLSIFYNQAYEALFRRHDAYKGAFNRERQTSLDIQDFSKVFSLFCLQTYEKRLFKMSRSKCLEFLHNSMNLLDIKVNPNDYLTDLLSAACLMVEDGLEITFSHRSFQEYFVALYISTAAPENQLRLIDRYWLNMRFDNVMQLLREINSELFERILLVTKLEELFNKLAIKKSVGITHLVKYIKYMYSEITYDHQDYRGVMFYYHNSKSDYKICENNLLHILAKDYAKFERKSVDENHDSEMRDKYFENNLSYETKLLSIKSPIINELNAEEGFYSISYLLSAYNAHKKLKAKHASTGHSFDVLLGLK